VVPTCPAARARKKWCDAGYVISARKQRLSEQTGNTKPHDVRRFVGTQLAKWDIRKAQKALGHKRIDTTAQHYVLDELEEGLTDDLY
jgi:integrase